MNGWHVPKPLLHVHFLVLVLHSFVCWRGRESESLLLLWVGGNGTESSGLQLAIERDRERERDSGTEAALLYLFLPLSLSLSLERERELLHNKARQRQLLLCGPKQSYAPFCSCGRRKRSAQKSGPMHLQR